MQWNGWEYLLLDDHLDRLFSSATALGFAFDRAAIATALSDKAETLRVAGGRHRVRLTLHRDGNVTLASEPFSFEPSGNPVRVCIAAERVESRDPLLRHKSVARERYDCAFREAQERGFGEVLFLNERGEVTEGAISNVFARIEGRWLTPPESCGLLNGVFRPSCARARGSSKKRSPSTICVVPTWCSSATHCAARGGRQSSFRNINPATINRNHS
jgi:para-aminobenzoate synthetase/4-amino-4-deoxychorismate lyase